MVAQWVKALSPKPDFELTNPSTHTVEDSGSTPLSYPDLCMHTVSHKRKLTQLINKYQKRDIEISESIMEVSAAS